MNKLLNNPSIKKLLILGQSKGILTYGEVNSFLPEDLLNSDQIEEVLTLLEQNNITLIDDEDLDPNVDRLVDHLGNPIVDSNGNNIIVRSNENMTSEKKVKDDLLYIPSKISILENNKKPTLGVEEMANSFARIIDETDNSTNFGIFGILGAWGRGKTYFINFIKDALKKNDTLKYTIIDFSAWQYQKAPELWAHLFETIAGKRFTGKMKLLNILYYNFISNKVPTILKIVIPILLFIFGILNSIFKLSEKINIPELYSNIIILTPTALTSFFILFKNGVKDNKKLVSAILKKQFSRRNFSNVLGIQNEIHNELQLLLKSWISDNKVKSNKIVLAVDDIDRCKPENILDFLDSLRVILENDIISSRLKVIIAIDHHIIKSQLETNFNNNYSNTIFLKKEKYIRDYFDKIFLFSIHLAPLLKEERLKIIDSITLSKDSKKVFISDSKIIEKEVKTFYEKSKSKSHQGSDKHNIINSEDVQISDYELKIFKAYIAEIDCSPRRLRILYYRYLYIKMLLEINDKNFFENTHFNKVLKLIADYEKNYCFTIAENQELIGIIKTICFD